MNAFFSLKVWIDAAVQIFYSVGAGFGVHLAYASYNKFNNNCYRDCLFTACINSFTSIFSGIVIFCYLGYMSNKHNKSIEQVAVDGPGLVFEVYPEAIATLPGSVGWSIVFFIMLITLGMDSAVSKLKLIIAYIIQREQIIFLIFLLLNKAPSTVNKRYLCTALSDIRMTIPNEK